MRNTFFTIAALLLMSASAFGKGEPSTQPGAPTGTPEMKPVSAIKVTYDDEDAMTKSMNEPMFIQKATKDVMYIAHVEDRMFYMNYYQRMGDVQKMHNLNYGTSAILPPLQGSIR
jgi:hypothetical protein